jgi:hypothetical protein
VSAREARDKNGSGSLTTFRRKNTISEGLPITRRSMGLGASYLNNVIRDDAKSDPPLHTFKPAV